MNARTSQQTLPAIPQRSFFESALRRNAGPALDALCRVFSVCIPIFNKGVQSLQKAASKNRIVPARSACGLSSR